MGSKRRYVILGTVALGVIVAMVLGHGFQWIWVQAGWDDPFMLNLRELPMTRVIGYAVALAAVVFVLNHKPTLALADEVVEELTKVTWPSREETWNATGVVIVAVFICSLYLGAFDAVWLWLTDWVLGIEPLQAG